MKLGAFSISLAVSDIQKSLTFYKTLGFTEFGGDVTQNWVILKNETTMIGLFQDMLPKNVLTFNPGWDQNAHDCEEFDDVREIEAKLLKAGIELSRHTENKVGPEYITLEDPDGNQIMFDQHRDTK